MWQCIFTSTLSLKRVVLKTTLQLHRCISLGPSNITLQMSGRYQSPSCSFEEGFDKWTSTEIQRLKGTRNERGKGEADGKCSVNEMENRRGYSYDKLWLGNVLQKQLWLDTFMLPLNETLMDRKC